MIEKMMNKATFHVVDGFGEEITKFEVDLLSVDIKFKYGNKFTEMWANNIRDPHVLVRETKKEIESMYAKQPKKVSLRNTTEIMGEVEREIKIRENGTVAKIYKYKQED